MRKIFPIVAALLSSAAFIIPASATAADNLDCAMQALDDESELMQIGFENTLSFGNPKQSFSKSGSSMDLTAAVAVCAEENGWSKSAAQFASQYTLASATTRYLTVQMVMADAPEDFGADLFADMSAAEMKTLRKSGKLSPLHMALVASTVQKYFGSNPKAGTKEMLLRWPQMLEDRDLAKAKFLKLAQ